MHGMISLFFPSETLESLEELSSRTQEFTALDENMTDQLLNIQKQALALAMLAQRAEDEQNAAMGGQTGRIEIKISFVI